MKITREDRQRFVTLTRSACYNSENKEEYRKLGGKILQFIVKEMGLKRGEYDIRWNPGGIACSGDHVLHTDKFYLALHDNVGFGTFYYRTCNGRNDYSGGKNMNVPWTEFVKSGGLHVLITCLEICNMPVK